MWFSYECHVFLVGTLDCQTWVSRVSLAGTLGDRGGIGLEGSWCVWLYEVEKYFSFEINTCMLKIESDYQPL